MTRAQLLALTGMAPPVWSMLKQRNVLPYAPDKKRERNTYDADDVLRLMVFVELTAGGKAQEQAAGWIRSELSELLESGRGAKGRGDWYFGAVAFTGHDEGEASTRIHEPILVRLADLDARIQKVVKLAELDPQELSEVFIINLSAVVRGLLARSRKIGIENELSEIRWLADCST